MNGIPGPTELEIKARIAALERKVTKIYEHLQIEEPAELGPGEVPDSVRDHLARGDKLKAVNAYREATGVGIGEAAKAVEEFEASTRPTPGT